jgi:NitT/TauT family transport system substrate-binding protein
MRVGIGKAKAFAVVAATILTVATACGGANAPASSSSAAAATGGAKPVVMQDATLRLDYIPRWYQAPFHLALARGYYKDAGINLTVLDGTGSGATGQVVAVGSDTFGLMSLGTMLLQVKQGADLKAIGGLMQRIPEAVISLSTANIKTPKDLEGKRYGSLPSGSGDQIFPAFVTKAGVKDSTFQKVTVDAASKLTSLLTGRVDFIIDWAATDIPLIAAQGKTANSLLFADQGVTMLGHGLVVNSKTISQKPDLVKAFMAASTKGLDEAIKDPAAAIDAMIASRSVVQPDRQIFIDQLKLLKDYLHTTASASKPNFWIAQEDMAASVATSKDLLGLQGDLDVTSLYTNDFIPAK